ncbi:MurR/RpiR family transcriptional regulator [Lactococcus fujiensis]|uniref:MurR/RpiR family transcriptional regulator n=1 Tax=Lactococcus fujiensis TaxID=610251 RepID=UPI0020931F72|nr:SIS domain-containing protein [Lactococcus fujiensis]
MFFKNLPESEKNVFFSQDLHQFSSSLVAFKRNAVFIAISNSGKTKELITLATIAEKFDIPVIALTSKDKSPLAMASEIVLNSTSGDTFVMRTAATMSLMAQLYVVDILFYSYLSNNYNESIAGIQATRDIIKKPRRIKKESEII